MPLIGFAPLRLGSYCLPLLKIITPHYLPLLPPLLLTLSLWPCTVRALFSLSFLSVSQCYSHPGHTTGTAGPNLFPRQGSRFSFLSAPVLPPSIFLAFSILFLCSSYRPSFALVGSIYHSSADSVLASVVEGLSRVGAPLKGPKGYAGRPWSFIRDQNTKKKRKKKICNRSTLSHTITVFSRLYTQHEIFHDTLRLALLDLILRRQFVRRLGCLQFRLPRLLQ